ncbi:hypothetical protein KKE60_08410, partial [Patescibacteria group bacterium]|nr:hypothetical protein [Patescibacteria group bacterium]
VDDRNFGSQNFAGVITRDDLPDSSFVVYDPVLIDQKDTLFCVGFSGRMCRDATEEIITSGSMAFSLAKKRDGSTTQGNGTSPLKVAKVLVESGICKNELYPLTGNGQGNYLANWHNIPEEAWSDALKHKGGSYFEVNIPWRMSKFEGMVAHLNKFKNQKLLIMTGADGHAITPIGYLKAGDNFKDILNLERPFNKIFSEDRLISKDSYDRSSMNYSLGYYKNGYRFFTVNEVSYFFTGYMITDIPRELAEILNRFTGKLIKSDGEDIFLVKDGKRWLFESEEALWSHNYYLTQGIEYLTPSEINLIPNGEKLTVENGINKELINEIVNIVAKNPNRFRT